MARQCNHALERMRVKPHRPSAAGAASLFWRSDGQTARNIRSSKLTPCTLQPADQGGFHAATLTLTPRFFSSST